MTIFLKKAPNKVTILEKHDHLKATERYVHVIFNYNSPRTTYDFWLPIEYRRTGINLKTDDEIKNYVEKVYRILFPKNIVSWKEEQDKFWRSKASQVTKGFFYALSKDLKWCCVDCDLPKNPNFARRIQDLKEIGYTISTDTNRYCPKCGNKKTHLFLVPIPRVDNQGNGYETFPKKLRDKIISTLESYDAYEGKARDPKQLIPDHKFSEIRWDSKTKAKNSESMTAEEIRDKFQLLTNQRNLQKREVCRQCFQTGNRGTIFGINYFYSGNENWDSSISKTGKSAEIGCVGCPWYDIEAWRRNLNSLIKKSK